jgi:hypothetical protein
MTQENFRKAEKLSYKIEHLERLYEILSLENNTVSIYNSKYNLRYNLPERFADKRRHKLRWHCAVGFGLLLMCCYAFVLFHKSIINKQKIKLCQN